MLNALIISGICLTVLCYGLGFFVDATLPFLFDVLANIWMVYPIEFFKKINLIFFIDSTFFTIFFLSLVDSIILTPFVLIIHALITKLMKKKKGSC